MAENYGVRISKTGTDVKTGTDANMLMTTKFSIPKAVNYEEINMDAVGDPYLYPHRAEFIPFVLVYATADGPYNKVMANYYNYNDPDLVQIWVSADNNNIRIMTSHRADPAIRVYAFVPEIDI